MAAPQLRLQAGSDRTKRREIRFQAVHQDPDQAGTALRLLQGVEGILDLAAPAPTRLEIEYDLGLICLRDIESALTEGGFHLDNSLWSRLARALWYYAEDTQRANMGCDDPRNCARRIFVDCYRQHDHGCRDNRPEHLRQYW